MQEGYSRTKDPTNVLGQTASVASKGTAEFSEHVLEIAQANMNAAFDFARQVAHVKTPSEFFQLSAAHMQKQFQTLTEQTKQLTNHAQTIASESAQSLQSDAAKTFKKGT